MRSREREIATTEARAVDAKRLLDLARSALERGDLNAAERTIEDALERCHSLAAAHHLLGRIRLRQTRFEDAADSLELALLFDSASAQAYADLAVARAYQGSVGAAHEAARSAVDCDGDSIEVLTICARAYKVLGALDDAEACYRRALGLRPDSADFAGQLGYVHYLRGEYEDARKSYETVLHRFPEHFPTWHNLGLLELEIGNPERALECFERAANATRLPETLACIGHALRDLGRLDEACAVYQRTLAEYPKFRDAEVNLSYALLMREDFASGWVGYESRFHAGGVRAREFGLPSWQGEPLAGRRLLVYGEQGLGDEIMFASCIPDLLKTAGQCVLECNERLARLFARSFPACYVHGGLKSDGTGWLSTVPRCDFQCAIGGLPRFFRPDRASFSRLSSYLRADSERVDYWRNLFQHGDMLNVGIAWRGGALRSRQFLRSIPLTQWSRVLDVPKCHFHALQHGYHEEELQAYCAHHDVRIEDRGNVCADIDELAALICALDLVITVDNTLGHLAGALGSRVWVLLPKSPEWRYPREGAEMLWYSSMTLFRQQSSGDWSPTLAQVCARLTQFAERGRS